MNRLFKGGMAAGVGIIGLVLVVPQATYAATPADHGRSARYTIAQVAVHNTPADCWTVVKHDVYDLTKWLPLHASAPISAAQTCGLNATNAFRAADATPHASQSSDQDSDNGRNHANRDGDKNGGDGENDGHLANAGTSSSAKTHHDGGGNESFVSLKKSIKSYKIGRLVRVMPTPTPTVTPTTTPTVTPTATPTPTPTPATVTGAQLATHNVLTNCWVAISGNVYNLTTFATTHSGGSAVIAPVCGKDGTSVFETRHGVGSSKINTLAQYKVGALVA